MCVRVQWVTFGFLGLGLLSFVSAGGPRFCLASPAFTAAAYVVPLFLVDMYFMTEKGERLDELRLMRC